MTWRMQPTEFHWTQVNGKFVRKLTDLAKSLDVHTVKFRRNNRHAPLTFAVERFLNDSEEFLREVENGKGDER